MAGKAFGRSLKPGERPGKSLGGGCVSDMRTPGGHTAEERKPQRLEPGNGDGLTTEYTEYTENDEEGRADILT